MQCGVLAFAMKDFYIRYVSYVLQSEKYAKSVAEQHEDATKPAEQQSTPSDMNVSFEVLDCLKLYCRWAPLIWNIGFL